ncbi:MAG: nicotinamide riboside transporter PnuC [Alphaproteobacteria bacterium]|jgi:nicotinamide mononucleotide transporter|nr:nicotinamide riboside transporter PnuC [Alphaproteobacteria bacterium]
MSLLVSFILSIQFLEWVSLVAGLLYIIYLIKEKRIAWLFGFISSTCLAIVVFSEQIYLQAILQAFYALIAIYGFIKWSKVDTKKKKVLKISEYPIKTHLVLIFIAVLISGSLAKAMEIFVESSYSTLDAFIFAFAILATYMQANKILSNWIYWIIINALTIILYLDPKLYVASTLMLIYLGLAIYGYIKWKKKISLQKES